MKNSKIIISGLSIVLLLIALLFSLTSPRSIGRRFNEKFDSTYVKDKLWSYNGGFKVSQGDFLEFRMDTTRLYLKGDTIFYNSKPRARITRLNKRLFQMKIESIETGEKGSYTNVEEMLQ